MSKKQKKQFKELRAMAVELNQLATNDRAHHAGLRNYQSSIAGSDTLHNIDVEYGYPQDLKFKDFYNMYKRSGFAKAVINIPVNTCWSTSPTIDADKSFQKEFDKLNERLNVWQRCKGLDKRQRVGRYAGMFMRVRDGKDPSEELEGVLNGESALVEMMPLYESQLDVINTDDDPLSDNFGQPILYQYSQAAEGSRNKEVAKNINIHASRVIPAAEGADDGWIYGESSLEGGFNSLLDLRKISGGGAEGFYKNAAQSIIFDLKDGASAISYKDKLDDFNEKFTEFTRNRFDKSIWTPNMEAKTLESSLMSPKDFMAACLSDLSASTGMASTIIAGHQTGVRASGEDQTALLSMCQSRRENFLSEMIANILDWCIKFGILSSSEYTVIWDDLLERSTGDKLESADKMTSINEKQYKSGGEIPFDGDEIREVAGFEKKPLENLEGETDQDESEE